MKWLLFSRHVNWVMVSVRGRKLSKVLIPAGYSLNLTSRMLSTQCAETKCLKLCHNLLHQFSLLYILHNSLPSSLYWCDKIIQSTEGVQQGDPLGPLLFCLSLHSVCCLLRSELRVFYLDDGTLGGSLEDIAHDLELIKKEACDIGLELNTNESEVISINESLLKSVQSILPGIREVDPAEATLCGSPIGDTTSISDAICAKTSFLKLLGERPSVCFFS